MAEVKHIIARPKKRKEIREEDDELIIACGDFIFRNLLKITRQVLAFYP